MIQRRWAGDRCGSGTIRRPSLGGRKEGSSGKFGGEAPTSDDGMRGLWGTVMTVSGTVDLGCARLPGTGGGLGRH